MKNQQESFNVKVERFFFGYSITKEKKMLYLIKRILWCLVFISSLKYWFGLIYHLIYYKDLSGLGLLFPAIVSSGIAILFFRFD